MVYTGQTQKSFVVSLALIDPVTKKSYLFEATPDFPEQLHLLRQHLNDSTHLPSAIFLTHAHVGHYAGLINLGKEIMGSRQMAVYTLPRMKAFLSTNGPWSQLVTLGNISLHDMNDSVPVALSEHITISAFSVPHRDEYSETAGFSIQTGQKKWLFIPDIDKWDKWFPQHTVTELTKLVSRHLYVLIDATFYADGELGNRNMKDIPHPFVSESMQLFGSLPASEKKKIYFIHFNHSNPLLFNKTIQKQVKQAGFNIATDSLILD